MTESVALVVAMGFALWAQFKVKNTYEKFTEVPASSGMTVSA